MRVKAFIEFTDQDKGIVSMLFTPDGPYKSHVFGGATGHLGNLTLEQVTPEMFAQFRQGQEFWIDLTPVD